MGGTSAVSCEDFAGGGLERVRPIAGPERMAACLARVRREGAASVAFLDEAGRRRLCRAVAALTMRRARDRVGAGDRVVTQDFDICADVARRSGLGHCAGAVEAGVNAGLRRLSPAPCAGVVFNDLVVQRYRPTRCGISPHRDHLAYTALVAVLVIEGAGRFFLCDDRSGTNAREIPAPAGSLLLMRAPGFDGRRERPFHMLGAVTRERLILGLRQDSRRLAD